MRRIAILAAAAVGLAAIAALAVPSLVSPDQLRQRIAERIGAASGRAVHISGEPNLSIYPHVAISAGGLTIANAEGMGDDPLASVEAVTARIRVLPLFLGRVEFESFTFTRPRIHLVRDAEGSGNWPLLADRNDKTAIALGRMLVTDGTVVFDDLATHEHEELTAVALDLNWGAPSSALKGSGSAEWREEAVEFNGSVSQPLDLISGQPSPVRFAIASTPLRVSFNGTATLTENARLEGDTSITSSSLRRVIAWLGTPMGTGSILGPASIDGAMSWIGPVISFDDASVSLDGNEAQGAVAISLSGERPAVQGTFAATKLDISPYIEAMRADMSADGPWPFAATRLPIADAFDCDLRFSAAEVLAGAVRLGSVAATTTIKDGALSADIGRAQAYGGALTARIAAKMAGDGLVAHVTAEATGVSAHSPLNDLFAVSALSGKAHATFDLEARGATWGAFAHSAAGTIGFDIADGTVAGVDVADLGKRMADPLAEPVPGGEGSTRFHRLAGTLAVAGSTISSDDVVLEGGDYTVNLSGRGSLLTGSVTGKARLAMNADDPVPLAITGTWRAPLFGPDQARVDEDSDMEREPRG